MTWDWSTITTCSVSWPRRERTSRHATTILAPAGPELRSWWPGGHTEFLGKQRGSREVPGVPPLAGRPAILRQPDLRVPIGQWSESSARAGPAGGNQSPQHSVAGACRPRGHATNAPGDRHAAVARHSEWPGCSDVVPAGWPGRVSQDDIPKFTVVGVV